MKKFFLTSLLLPLFTFAQNQPSNEEISSKLDLILSKVASLEKRVSNLESDNKEVRQEVKVVAQSAEEAKKSIKAIPQVPEEKKSFLQNLGSQLKTQETLDSGAWTQKSSWTDIRKNLSPIQVRKLLGTPMKIKKSINPRIDQVFLYYGDLDADGKMEEGSVSFHRNRVMNYESPFK
jgi:outer membrane murein-binding lipoprotein Lpp